MSSKIYEGRRFNKNLSMAELVNFRYNLIREATKIKNKKLSMCLGKFTAKICDKIAIGEDTDWDNCVGVNLKHYITMKFRKEAEISATAKSKLDCNVDTNLTFNLMIYPVSSRTILCLPMTEHQEFIALLDSQPEISKYEYWDSSERPSKISAQQWAARRKNWKKAMSNGGACRDSGILMEIIPEWDICNDIYSIEATCFPDKATRARKLAFDILFNERNNKLSQVENPQLSASMRIFMQLSEEKELIAKKAAEIEPLLWSNLNAEFLSKIVK